MDEERRAEPYPRALKAREREWIEWILPDDSPAYRRYRDLVAGMSVIGEGRRGAGELILGAREARPDFDDPLAPVFAYGAVETSSGMISITLREERNGQVSVEIVSHRSAEVPEVFSEIRRWTYSTWRPGSPCPQCGRPPRQVAVRTTMDERFELVVCSADKRIWVHEHAAALNRLIPVTNYYNELMLHKNIRDPALALDSGLLFRDLAGYTDADLTLAFMSYNRLKSRVRLEGAVAQAGGAGGGVRAAWRSLFGGKAG